MRFLFLLSFLLTGLFFQPDLSAQNSAALKNGDLIFIVNPSGQGQAIQLATHSRYTHVGIVFIEDGKTVVYHAVEPVIKSSLQDFVSMSKDKTYEIKRLKNQQLLSEKKVALLLAAAREDLGKHYDLAFGWDDEKLYCSEYVWKIYKQALDLEIGSLKPLRSFDLSHPAVKQKLRERYGDRIPMEEKMISPGDMYDSSLLE